MVSVIYQGDSKINITGPGFSKVNVSSGDVIPDIPQKVWDEELRFDSRFRLAVEKTDVNKMEKSTHREGKR